MARAFAERADQLLAGADRRRRGLGAWVFEETGYLHEARDVVGQLVQCAHAP